VPTPKYPCRRLQACLWPGAGILVSGCNIIGNRTQSPLRPAAPVPAGGDNGICERLLGYILTGTKPLENVCLCRCFCLHWSERMSVYVRVYVCLCPGYRAHVGMWSSPKDLIIVQTSCSRVQIPLRSVSDIVVVVNIHICSSPQVCLRTIPNTVAAVCRYPGNSSVGARHAVSLYN